MYSKLLFSVAIAVLIPMLIGNRLGYFSQPSSEENLSSDKIWQLEAIPLIADAKGPESYAFDPHGKGPYTGLSDGRIVKWEEHERRWIDFAVPSLDRGGCGGPHNHELKEHICGRPLGMRFNESSGDLYIADSYLGLLKVGPEGGVATTIATHAQGIPFKFTNGLDIDPHSGALYFTDSSSRFERRNYIATVLSGDNSGRLMKYDPESNQITVLLGNLSLPNGVILSKDGNYILFAESLKCRILKYWLKTSKAGTVEVFAELQGITDNINRSPRGGYWVAIYTKKDKALKWVLSYPLIGKVVLRLPINAMKIYSLTAKYRGSGMGVRLSEDGDILETFYDKSVGSLSEVTERDGYLWVGSVNMPFAGRYKI